MQESGREDVRGYESSEVCTELHQQLLTLTEEESSVLGKGEHSRNPMTSSYGHCYQSSNREPKFSQQPGEIFSTLVSGKSHCPL